MASIENRLSIEKQRLNNGNLLCYNYQNTSLVVGKTPFTLCNGDLKISIEGDRNLPGKGLKGAVANKALKKDEGFNGIGTHDLRDTGPALYQLSYQSLGEHVKCEFNLYP